MSQQIVYRWIVCPNCDGEIGIPSSYRASMVECPNCQAVVGTSSESHFLWRPKRRTGDADSSDVEPANPESAADDRCTPFEGVRSPEVPGRHDNPSEDTSDSAETEPCDERCHTASAAARPITERLECDDSATTDEETQQVCQQGERCAIESDADVDRGAEDCDSDDTLDSSDASPAYAGSTSAEPDPTEPLPGTLQNGKKKEPVFFRAVMTLFLCIALFVIIIPPLVRDTNTVNDTNRKDLTSNVIETARKQSKKAGNDEARGLRDVSAALPEEISNSIGMSLTLIPSGEFLMGSPKSKQNADDNEYPQHRVWITKPYYLSVAEVTQHQWQTVMGTEPWHGKEQVKKGADYPAVYVDWDGAVAFCEELSRREGMTYRLPTEAEWEYACRAATSTTYHFGDDVARLGDYAWFAKNALRADEKYPHRIGQKKPNAFGLYDMHGNVWEWCQDWYEGKYYIISPTENPTGPSAGSRRVVRGGCWYYSAEYCRSSSRLGSPPTSRSSGLGFRVARNAARTLPE